MVETLRQLTDAKPDILDADLLLFRGKGLISRMIRQYGRGKYSHVAKTSWIKGKLFCVEVRELKGGRIVTLESQVKKFPGQIDVFRANALSLPEIPPRTPAVPDWKGPVYNRPQADLLMLAYAGVEYGYWAIFQTWLLHAPFVRMIAQADLDDEFVSQRPPYCSAACAAADRVGGRVDTVSGLSDKDTEPNDLARSPFYGYMFTLIPDEPKPEKTEDDVDTNETNTASRIMLKAEKTDSEPPTPVAVVVSELPEVKP